MESAFALLSLETLQAKLVDAIDALHSHHTRPSVMASNQDRVEYNRKSADLERYVSQLQQAINQKQGGARRGPIRLAF